MNYELALKLKEAGFPQHEEESFINCPYKGCWMAGDTYGYENTHNPTLKELIDACGEYFVLLYKSTKMEGYRWEAEGNKDKENHNFGKGDTPLEAVAHLYLSLQDKK